jgi:activator of HSP90 ATPase
MSIEFEVSDVIPASPDELYAAWLTSDEHSKMTGSPARVSDKIGEAFEAWDGYIQGKNLELEPPRRILQHWRTSEFEDSDQDSLLEILFESTEKGSRVTIRHSELPEHGMQYRQGWIDAYFIPMNKYFGERS